MSFHTLVLVGHLGADPEMRFTPNGQPVTSMRVASNRTYTDSSGAPVKETIWFNVSVWGKQAESVNTYLKKGSMVLIEGELRPDKETGNPRTFMRKDGNPGASYDVNARTVRFLTPRGESTESYSEGGGELSDEDIPF